MAVYFGTKYGHNFDEVITELFHWGFIFQLVDYGDFSSDEVSDLEDDFATKSEEPVFVSYYEFFYFSL